MRCRAAMATDMQRLVGTSEDDDEEDMEMDVKEEDDDEEDDMEKHISTPPLVGVDGLIGSSSNNNRFHHPQIHGQVSIPGGGVRRRLRRHGNYNLRVRADINDVIAALAREAGWVVLPDGTTFPSRSQGSKPISGTSAAVTPPSSQMVPQQAPLTSLRGISSGYRSPVDYNASRMKGVYVPNSSPYDSSSRGQSQISPALGDGGEPLDTQTLIGGSVESVDAKQIVDVPSKLPERDFAGTPYIPVYVTLPLGVINVKSELVDPDGLLKQLRILKSLNVDGVTVDCWWGVVEAHAPQEYNWNGYRRLFQMVHELQFKLQVVMSFHECGGNVEREDATPECLSWGIDKERVLRGRTAIEVYFDYMRSFRAEFNEYFEDGLISMIGVGLGPCGELRYPSNPVKNGWRYPGIGEFQCYDQYLLKNLRKAAEARGQDFWARGPDNAGSYNAQPQETGFFCDGGDYDGYFGRFFLKWYSQVLIDHGDRVLALAKLAFDGTCIAAKLSGLYWWYRTASHAAELTAGFYNPSNRDGYAAIAAMLKKHGAALNFTCAQLHVLDQQENFSSALADPDGLAWQVLNAAWDYGIPITSENFLPCHNRVAYNKMLDGAKLLNDPDGRHFLSFTYLRLNSILMERQNLLEFERFVKRMHGEAVHDL
ncbi:hypothetical protein NL676_010599 [Syzygium grande]|nr:hypothetical protein NL676_010599 [Syzygium grande]